MKRLLSIGFALLLACTAAFSSSARAQSGFDMNEAEFVARLNSMLAQASMEARRFTDADNAYYTIGDTIDLWLTIDESTVAELLIEGSGDGGAKSGQQLMNTMLACVRLMSGEKSDASRATLIRLLNELGGTAALGEAAISMSWDVAGSIVLSIGRAEVGEMLPKVAAPAPESLSDILQSSAKLLPEKWQQSANQLNQIGYDGDAIISVYMNDVTMEPAWNHALKLTRYFWTQAYAGSIDVNRLSIVYYSTSLAPVLSIAIDATAAASTTLWADAGTAIQDLHDWLAQRQLVGDALMYEAYQLE